MKRAQSLPGDAILVQNPGLLTTEVDGELMAMSVEKGTCYGLNGVGSRIWALIAEPRSIDSLCRQLVGEFDVEEERCRREVEELVEELRAEGMLIVRTE